MKHDIAERRSPVNILVMCSCGWIRTFTRHQNALGRAAKIRGAINQHDRDVAEREAEREKDKPSV